MKRYANRRDANEPEIVKALREIGCDVMYWDDCDLIVGRNRRTLLLECKDGDKPPSARKLTPNQIILRDTWRGHYAVVKSIDEAIAEVLEHTKP
jgi:hypothetical protein